MTEVDKPFYVGEDLYAGAPVYLATDFAYDGTSRLEPWEPYSLTECLVRFVGRLVRSRRLAQYHDRGLVGHVVGISEGDIWIATVRVPE